MLQDPARNFGSSGDRDRSIDRRIGVGYRSFEPAADLVPKRSRPTDQSIADWPFSHHPSLATRRPHRSHLDRALRSVDRHDHGGVIQLTATPPSSSRGKPLVEPTTPTHQPTASAGAQWDPVQVDPVTVHGTFSRAPGSREHSYPQVRARPRTRSVVALHLGPAARRSACSSFDVVCRQGPDDAQAPSELHESLMSDR